MISSIFATKQSMTQTWDKSGSRLPVTILQIPTHTVTQVKTPDTDQYHAVQFGIGIKRQSLINKPLAGHLKKSGDITPRYVKEIRLNAPTDLKPQDTLSAEQVLQVGDVVKITGRSKGKGFAGVVKRHGFRGGPRTHGQSDRLRAPGSIGQGTDPGRVWPGKRMAGRLGNTTSTTTNLTVVKVTSNGEVWIKGLIPGPIGGLIKISKTGTTQFSGLVDQHQDETTNADATAKADSDSTQDQPSDSASDSSTESVAPDTSEPSSPSSPDTNKSEKTQ